MAIIGLIGCGVSLRKPYLGLLMLVVLYFFRPDLWGAETHVKPVLWLTIALLVGWYRHRTLGRPLAALPWLIVLLSIYALSTALGPFSDARSWLHLQDLAKVFVVVFLITELCDTPGKLAGLLAAVLVGNLWFVKVTLLGWLAAGFSDTVRIDTAVGQGGGSNYIAWVLATTTPLLVFKIVRGAGWQRLAAAAMLPLWLASILATGSRGGMLCAAAGLFVLLMTMRQTRLLVTLVVIVALFLQFAPSQRMQRAQTITLDPEKMDYSMLVRYQNAQMGLRMMADRPLFGTGLGTFPKAKLGYLPRDYVGGKEHVAHNTLIQMGTEVGVVFLAAFLLLSLYVVLRLRSPTPDTFGEKDANHMEWVRTGMLAALGVTAVQALKGDMARLDYFWWLYGISIAYHVVRTRAADAAMEAERPAPKPKPKRVPPPWLA
ncbi:MAG TPA: O-antigen ligase family protein, partial [Phycisphaerae bacterium]|nr:O-antigen ligase family protein [Phycisphaerae bacterium]